MRIIRDVNAPNLWRVAYASTTKWLPRSCYSKASNAARKFFARRIAAEYGAGGWVERGATFTREIRVGNHVELGYFCEVYGPVSIGDNSLIGPYAVVFTSNHGTSRTDIPIRDQPSTTPRPVTIGEDCWLGMRSMIMPGVTIGAHSVVAAGAVVTKDVPPYSVVAGVPARVVKSRLSESRNAVEHTGQ